MQDQEIDNLEKMIPLLASGAVTKAYLDSLSAGNVVLEVQEGILYEVYPSGTKKKIKDVPVLIEVDMNKKVYL
jgi:hypothetical protein